MTVSALELVEVLFVNPDGLLQLLDVLGSALPEGGLGLTVPLLSFLRGCVYLLAVRALAWIMQ